MENLHHDGARVRAPESGTERGEHARITVEEARRQVGLALASVDRAISGLADVKRTGPAMGALFEVGAMLLVEEERLRGLLLGRVRLHDDVEVR